MKTSLSVLALIASLGLATAAMAQDAPTGGPAAKGNAPLKNLHSINDGSAKPGANSFTQNEARKHVLNAGYSSVSGLAKGRDGIWRGTAMKGGASMPVAIDFKGNITEGGEAGMTKAMTSAGPDGAAGPAMAMRHHHHWRHHHMRKSGTANCGHPGANGAACSGVDGNRDGIADKDEHPRH